MDKVGAWAMASIRIRTMLGLGQCLGLVAMA